VCDVDEEKEEKEFRQERESVLLFLPIVSVTAFWRPRPLSRLALSRSRSRSRQLSKSRQLPRLKAILQQRGQLVKYVAVTRRLM
jgi:hypothetical protein